MKTCTEKGIAQCQVVDLKDYDPEDTLTSEVQFLCFLEGKKRIKFWISLAFEIKENHILVIIISTYTDGQAPPSAAWFHKYVTEMSCDFRFQKDALKGMRYAVCGLGNRLYAENFNKAAIDIDRAFADMQASRVLDLQCCDENMATSKCGSLEADFDSWLRVFVSALGKMKVTVNGCCQTNVSCCRNPNNDEKAAEYETRFSDFYIQTTLRLID